MSSWKRLESKTDHFSSVHFKKVLHNCSVDPINTKLQTQAAHLELLNTTMKFIILLLLFLCNKTME